MKIKFDQDTYFGCEADERVEVCIQAMEEISRDIVLILFTEGSRPINDSDYEELIGSAPVALPEIDYRSLFTLAILTTQDNRTCVSIDLVEDLVLEEEEEVFRVFVESDDLLVDIITPSAKVFLKDSDGESACTYVHAYFHSALLWK